MSHCMVEKMCKDADDVLRTIDLYILSHENFFVVLLSRVPSTITLFALS